MTFELSREDYQTLLLALGMAAGTASREGDDRLFRAFTRLANTVNKDNPDWTPYEVPTS